MSDFNMNDFAGELFGQKKEVSKMKVNISVDNRPVKVQQEEWFEKCKDWEIRTNVFLDPNDTSKTEFYMQKHIYEWFLKWKKEGK